MSIKPMDVSADATELARRVGAGEITAVELTEAAIRRVEEVNPKLNAIIIPLFDKAREQARTARSGAFTGVPYAKTFSSA
jgi:Asp-tRNA(Asn)/Glu-tRNA(Gln) amidotransferase A subunit family amidase